MRHNRDLSVPIHIELSSPALHEGSPTWQPQDIIDATGARLPLPPLQLLTTADPMVRHVLARVSSAQG